jgi:hypothetical protein
MSSGGHEDLIAIAGAFALSAGLSWVAVGDKVLSKFIDYKKEPLFFGLTGAFLVTLLSFQVFKFIAQVSSDRNSGTVQQ